MSEKIITLNLKKNKYNLYNNILSKKKEINSKLNIKINF